MMKDHSVNIDSLFRNSRPVIFDVFVWHAGSAVCGLATRVEPQQGDGDDTSLNDVRLYCCEVLEETFNAAILAVG